MIWFIAACTDGGGTTIEPLPTETTPQTPPGSPDLVITDDNVHTYEAEWVFASIPVQAASELFIDWEGVTVDAYGATRTPESFATAVLFDVEASQLNVQTALATDTLAPANTFRLDIAGKTELRTTDFAGFDPSRMLPSPDRTLLLALCDDDGARINVREGLVLEPTDPSGTFLSVPNGGASFTWLGQIDGNEVRTDAGADAYTVDWSAVTTDGYGNPFSSALGDELFVGRFDAEDEADDLGSDLLALQAVSTGWWTLGVAGTTSAALADATGTDGAFPGFEGDVVYLIGVRCTTCLGPAPSWVAGVRVRATTR